MYFVIYRETTKKNTIDVYSLYAISITFLKHKIEYLHSNNGINRKVYYSLWFIISKYSCVFVVGWYFSIHSSDVQRQYIGEHIRCITGGGIPDHVVNTYCFFTTTFTVVSSDNSDRYYLYLRNFCVCMCNWYQHKIQLCVSLFSKQARHYNETLLQQGYLPHPGIGPMNPNEEVKHHAYYQWVSRYEQIELFFEDVFG